MRRKYIDCGRLLAAVMCQFLVLQPLLAQQASGQRALRIVVVEGSGARNVVQQIAPRPLIVRIVDANNRPVAGAMVEFRSPEAGPSGDFVNNFPVPTSDDGLASAGAFHPNAIPGPYQIQVRAAFQGQTAIAAIPQTNIEQKSGRGKLIAILAIAGAAAGAAIAARSGGGSSDPSSPEPAKPTIAFGGSAVGAPNR